MPWSSGPTVEECSDVLRSSIAAGRVDDDTNAVLFHDLDLMRSRLSSIADSFPPTALHALAIKANPLVEVLRTAVDAGAGLEAASIEEVEVALLAGCPADRIVFDSPAKTRAEIARALDLGVMLNADSVDELERIAGLRRGDCTSVVGIRINPMVGMGRIPATSVGAADSKFGVPLHAADELVLPAIERMPWVRALHVHVGSQGCSLEQLVAAATVVDELRRRWNGRLGSPRLDVVDIGGGLPTTYVAGDAVITPAAYAAALRRAVPDLFGPAVRLVTEFGRVVQAHCGWAASRVEYVKELSGGPMAVIHLGADLLLRTVYQPEHWTHRFDVLAPDGSTKVGARQDIVSLAGPLCFAGDVIARGVRLTEVAEGDWVVIHDVGAYTLSMWSRHCSRGLPLVLGHERSGPSWTLRTLRERERPTDVGRFWTATPSGG